MLIPCKIEPKEDEWVITYTENEEKKELAIRKTKEELERFFDPMVDETTGEVMKDEEGNPKTLIHPFFLEV